MTGHPFSFAHPGFSEVGDHHIRVRVEEAPPISTERIALVSHQGVREPMIQAGDWIVRVQVPGFDVLDSLVAQFPGNFCWFSAESFNLAQDGMLSAFVWIAELKGLTSYHDVYCQSEQAAADVTPLLQALSHNFRGFKLTKIVGRISFDPLQAHSLVDLTGRYSEPTLVRVLPADAIAASAIAPKSSDYMSPTWGEYIRTKMNQNEPTFRKIIRHLSPNDYKDLYIVYEAILSSLGSDKKAGAKEIVLRGWATDTELTSFWKTAHNHFRHFASKPQQEPFMDPCVADDLIRRIFRYFIVDCMQKDGLKPKAPDASR
jgi:hypothetical protein